MNIRVGMLITTTSFGRIGGMANRVNPAICHPVHPVLLDELFSVFKTRGGNFLIRGLRAGGGGESEVTVSLTNLVAFVGIFSLLLEPPHPLGLILWFKRVKPPPDQWGCVNVAASSLAILHGGSRRLSWSHRELITGGGPLIFTPTGVWPNILIIDSYFNRYLTSPWDPETLMLSCRTF